MKKASALTRRRQKNLLDAIERFRRIFWGPDPADCAAMITGAFFLPFENLKSVLTDETAGLLEEIQAFLKDFNDTESLYRCLEETYIRLFINARGGIQAPLYQSCYEYENAPLMGTAAVEMKKRFEAGGLTLAEKITEPPDHLCIELEYLYFLLNTGSYERKDPALQSAGSFAAETMLPWVSAFAGRLQPETACRFYLLAARLLVMILESVAGLGAGKSR